MSMFFFVSSRLSTPTPTPAQEEGEPTSEPFLSLVIKTKLVQNVNRMSESQSDRLEDIHYTVPQAERQNDSMTVWQNSRAAKEPALV